MSGRELYAEFSFGPNKKPLPMMYGPLKHMVALETNFPGVVSGPYGNRKAEMRATGVPFSSGA